MKGIPKPRKGSDMLAWRSRQGRGEIMKLSTFKKIAEESSKRYGSKEIGQKVAGSAYWKTVRKKYKKSLLG